MGGRIRIVKPLHWESIELGSVKNYFQNLQWEE